MLLYLVQAFLALLPAPLQLPQSVSLFPGTEIAPTRQFFQSQNLPEVELGVVLDSGVCETTPGVRQISGYVTVGTNMSMWFWFFEARNSPETAPFTLWLNGGPGCSSMIGLFQENGPCTVNPDGETTTNNTFSWNNLANMIYIDQPIGSGFSFGTETVNSTMSAAPYLWKAFQVLFESGQFSKYKSRQFILATESYGGHYGPAFVTYFNEQNQLIQQGKLEGEKVVFSALMINNGWYSGLINYQAHVDFSTNAPGYGRLHDDSVIKQLNDDFYGKGGCQDQLQACYDAGNSTASNKICHDADTYCLVHIQTPAEACYDPYDLRQSQLALFPPSYYINFLNDTNIRDKIGAKVPYSQCSDTVAQNFNMTGDEARSMLSPLSKLVDNKLKTLMWAGDADIDCNWVGNHAAALAMNWYGKDRLKNTPFTNITFHGKLVAAVQNVDNFSFARVYDAGHEVPAFQPEASLEILRQVIHNEPLHSV